MVRMISPRLVGRGEELQRLVRAFNDCCEHGAGVLLVSGEAGIGKTRLVTELAGVARRDDATVLVGGCLPIGGEAVPNAPLTAMLRALVADTDAHELDHALGPARDDLAWLLPRLGTGRPDGEPPSTGSVCELVLGVFERLAERAPLVVAFEDLHWADATTRALVAFLARSLTARHRVLLVATYRSDELHREHPLLPLLAALQRLHPPQGVELEPLSRPRIAELAQAITGDEASEAEVDRIERLSQGNPFYVEELLAVPSEAGVPTDLRRVVHARLMGFPEEQIRLLRLVAAAEVPVDLATLTLVAGEPAGELEDAARQLVERHALVCRDTGVELRHALVQEVLYGELLPGERERVHAAFARALQTAGPERTGEIAYHWWRAGDLERALPAAVEAGQSAERIGATAEAHTCYARALAMWENLDDAGERTGIERADLVRAASQTAVNLYRIDRAVELVESELGSARPVDPLREAKLWEVRWISRWLRLEPSLPDLERAVERLRAAPAPRTRDDQRTAAELLAAAARGFALSGRPERALDVIGEALEAARAIGSAAIESAVRSAEARVLAFRGDERAITQVKRALALAHRGGDHILVSRAAEELAWDLMQIGRFEDALVACDRGVETTRQVGMFNVHGYFIELARIETLYRMGRWAEAVNHAKTLPENAFQEPPRHPTVPPVLCVRQGGGDAERLRREQARSSAFGEDPNLVASTGLALLELEAREGRFDEARAVAVDTLGLLLPDCLTEGSEVAASAVGVEADRAMVRRDGDEAFAQRIVDRLRDAACAGVGERITAFVAQAEAELRRLRRAASAAEWRAVAARWEAIGERYPAAYGAFRAAEAELVATARPDGRARMRAAELLARAAGSATELGAAPLLADIDDLARRARLDLRSAPAAGGSEPEPASDDLGMTPREREVLCLLAEGRSNGDIGRALFISTKTASTHVSNILRKLGAANRVEAAGVAIRLGLSGAPEDN